MLFWITIQTKRNMRQMWNITTFAVFNRKSMSVLMRRFAGTVCGVLLCLFAAAQSGTIRGFVYVKETGEPEPFVNVYLDTDVKYGTTTDGNGYFSLSKIPTGKYTLYMQSIGYDLIAIPVEITKNNQIVSKKGFLESGAIDIGTYTVEGTRTEAQTNVQVSVITATPTIIGYVPTVGGQADLATYVQTLPGAVFTGDQGGQLYIRGGSPIQNMVLLDEMLIYNPFHSIGFFSVFDTDIIRQADIYTGGFNAEYGGRISSVMDITTRDGNKKRVAGKLSVSPFMTTGLIEGPIKKDDGSGNSSTFLFSGKTSYLEHTSKVLYTPIDGIDSLGLPFNFTDLYGKVSFNGGNGSKINLFGFRYDDQVTYQAVQDFNWNSFGVGSNFILVPGNSPILMEGNFAYSKYGISLEETQAEDQEDPQPRSSEITGFNFGLDFKYFMRENELKYGIDISGYRTDFSFFNSVGRRIEQTENTTELAGFLTYKISAANGLLVIEPGLHLHYYASNSTFSPEPRLGAKWNATEKLRFKAAAGVYSQNLISANSDRDVVNLFYGFLSSPDNYADELTLENGETKTFGNSLQKANHLIIGTEYDVTDKININVEGYIKDFTQLTNMNRNKIFEDNAINFFRPEALRKDFIIETGKAMGVDFVMKYQSLRTYIWAVYSLGKVTRWDGVVNYSPIFDRRHNVNLVYSYKWGQFDKDLSDEEKARVTEFPWEFTARWNLGSGLPFTQTQGYYELIDFEDGINTDLGQANGDLGLILSDLNDGRLPWYHRMDINVKRKWNLKNKTAIEGNFGITNLYNRKNIFYVNRVSNERVFQLPILPSIGFNWVF